MAGEIAPWQTRQMHIKKQLLELYRTDGGLPDVDIYFGSTDFPEPCDISEMPPQCRQACCLVFTFQEHTQLCELLNISKIGGQEMRVPSMILQAGLVHTHPQSKLVLMHCLCCELAWQPGRKQAVTDMVWRAVVCAAQPCESQPALMLLCLALPSIRS